MADKDERLSTLLAGLTLEEKVGLLAGASMWYTTPVERLGIPAIKVTDGPNGARGDGLFTSGTPTTCFPAGVALAASWDVELLEEVGRALGDETRAKGAHVLLGPTVNIHRSPLNGRNFECYSEDPLLAARMAVAYIRGVQSRGVGTSIKHYAGNNSEFERTTISSEIGERALREIYLCAFETAVAEAGPWTVMASYNRLNGTYASEHPQLLTSILREEWGFDGVVVSDWFATHSTAAAVNAGLDLEMPGPTTWRGAKLVQAVRDGTVAEATIDAAALRVLRLIERAGALDQAPDFTERTIDTPEQRALNRRAAASGIVLLKNDGVLPLDPASLRRVAVIGPTARAAAIMGGGSAQVNASRVVTPLEGLRAALGSGVVVEHAIGCAIYRETPAAPAAQLAPERGQSGGLQVTYYNSLDLSGQPVHEALQPGSELAFFGSPPAGVDREAFSLRLRGFYTPAETGPHRFGLSSSGRSRLSVDGRPLIDAWSAPASGAPGPFGSAESTAELTLTAGEPVEIVVEYSREGAGMLPAVRLGVTPVVPADSIERAAELARSADVALLLVGATGEWESEGFDRPDMELVGRQNELIAAVCAANPRTVVVLQTGSPSAMPWLDAAAAVVQAWLGGQEAGGAIADVLLGAVDASGRLPQTFPRRLADNPAFLNYPGEAGKVLYGEGVFVGYRYYEKKDIAPLFPFGFGLSYTSFEYGDVRLSREALTPDDELVVEVDVRNSGARSGVEVVQLYVRDVEAAVLRPEKELKGFARLALRPGETGTARMTLDRRSFAYWDVAARRWRAEAGEFELLVGRSSQEIVRRARVRLSASAHFGGPGRPLATLTIESPLAELLASEAAAEILERHVPGLGSHPSLGLGMQFPLVQLAAFEPQTFSEERLRAIAADLAAAAR